MTIRPLSLLRSKPTDPAPAPGHAPLDYRRYSDDQLMAERERRQRQLDELTLQADDASSTYSPLVGIAEDIEQITEELIRRARSRHPSSFHPAS